MTASQQHGVHLVLEFILTELCVCVFGFSAIPIDYNLYRKFWTLQDYFRNPVQCYDKFSWITFIKYSDETLAVFKSFKLDDTQASRRKREEMHTAGGEHVYFAKFLTSEKVCVVLYRVGIINR